MRPPTRPGGQAVAGTAFQHPVYILEHPVAAIQPVIHQGQLWEAVIVYIPPGQGGDGAGPTLPHRLQIEAAPPAILVNDGQAARVGVVAHGQVQVAIIIHVGQFYRGGLGVGHPGRAGIHIAPGRLCCQHPLAIVGINDVWLLVVAHHQVQVAVAGYIAPGQVEGVVLNRGCPNRGAL